MFSIDIKKKNIGRLALIIALSILLQCFPLTRAANAETVANLSVSIQSANWIQLKWDDYLTNENYYILEKKVDEGAYQTLFSLPNIATYTDHNVSAGHTYTYRVRAMFADGHSYQYTQELTFRTDEIETPVNLTATPVSTNQIDLKWEYPSNKAYNTIIERRVESDTVWYPIANIGIGQNTYSDKSVTPGTRYYYRVSAALNDNVRSVPCYDLDSEGYSLLLKPTEVYGYALNQKTIQLFWKDNSIETAFILERKSSDNGIFEEIAVIPNNITTYIDNNLDPDKIYTYRIKAVSGTAASEYSDPVSIASTYLAAPGKLSSSSIDGTSVKLEWQDLTSTETGFEIWRKTGTNPVWVLYDTMGRNAKTYTDQDISSLDTYTYRIRAKINKNSVYSAYSNETSVWSSTIPAPTDLKFETVSKTEIKLEWKDTSMAEEGFRVERKMGIWGDWYTIALLNPDTVSYDDKWVNEANIYYYRIKVYDRSNSVNYSNEVIASTRTPEVPTGLQANPLSSSEIQLTWNDNSINEDGFIIEAMNFNAYKEVGRVPANTTTYKFKTAWTDRTIYFRVRAVNGENQSEPSNEAIAATLKKITYSDLGGVSWALEAINNLASRNVFDAVSGSKFYPDQNVTRGEFCAILVRSLGLGMVPAGSVTDVDSRNKYYKEIMTAYKLGIISSDSSRKIYPNNYITREQAGLMLALALKAAGTPLPDLDSSTLKEFADYKSISEASADRIADVCGAGILTGRKTNGKNYLVLNSYVTRAEAAVMAYKAIKL